MKNKNLEKAQAGSKPLWEWLALLVILLLTVSLRLWGLDKNGYGNPYYAAAVRSMLMNWHNFFFVSFDPTGYVTVDKPPMALWIQTLSAKLFGYRGFTLILPQILEGLCSVALVYHLVRRRFDASSAILSALAMALCPICVAVDRYNNVDACLVTVLLLAALVLNLAVEKEDLKLLLLSMVLVGIGFNTKMMVAFIVLPTFYLFYWLGASGTWKKRFGDLTISSVVLAIVALSWPLIVDFTPANQRPFVGSTQDNSMISLSLGWNGFQRLLRGRGRNFGAEATPTISNESTLTDSDGSAQDAVTNQPGSQAGFAQSRRRGGRGGRMGMGTGTPGLLRLADSNMAGQVAWFLPLCVLGLWVRARKTKFFFPLNLEHRTLLLWGGWFLTYAMVFSFMKGAMHNYYLVMLAPPLAILTGIGIVALWEDYKSNLSSRLFPLSLVLAAVWQVFIISDYPEWGGWLIPVLLTGIAVALVGFSRIRASQQDSESFIWQNRSFMLALLTLFLSPFAWALTPVLGSGTSVEANPYLVSGDSGGRGFAGGFQNNVNTDKLFNFLQANHRDEKYLVVAQNSMAVSPLIIKTGASAIPLGGFMGGDPTCTVEQFAQKVKDHQLRYFLVGGMGWGNPYGQEAMPNNRVNETIPNNSNEMGGGLGNQNGFQTDITNWVRENGEPVDPKLWRIMNPQDRTSNNQETTNNGSGNGFEGGRRGGAQQLYDLRPSGS